MVLLDSATPVIRVTLNDLSRLPVDQLARLLLERAAEDPRLLNRLHATIEEGARGGARIAATSPLPGPAHVVGESPVMRHVSELIRRFAHSDDLVLITGESGTGKELAARAIHEGSRRNDGPFVTVNCAAIPSNLVASELFGYERGAFTGANARTKGQIEHADGGTLFLDEIGDMPVDLQGHLLRFLQDAQIARVGARETININVRIVAATNVRLREAIAVGRFREDLYYRLNVLTLWLPPLRERHEDLEPLARHFLATAARDFGRNVTDFEQEALAALRRHSWPGNVRELMSTLRRAVVIGDDDKVQVRDLTGIGDAPRPAPAPHPRSVPKAPSRAGSNEERAALLAALDCHGENVTLTARELGVSRVTLYSMLRRHSVILERGLKEPPITLGKQAANRTIPRCR